MEHYNPLLRGVHTLRFTVILRRNSSNDGKVSAAAPAPANWNILRNTIPQSEINQVFSYLTQIEATDYKSRGATATQRLCDFSTISQNSNQIVAGILCR